MCRAAPGLTLAWQPLLPGQLPRSRRGSRAQAAPGRRGLRSPCPPGGAVRPAAGTWGRASRPAWRKFCFSGSGPCCVSSPFVAALSAPPAPARRGRQPRLHLGLAQAAAGLPPGCRGSPARRLVAGGCQTQPPAASPAPSPWAPVVPGGLGAFPASPGRAPCPSLAAAASWQGAGGSGAGGGRAGQAEVLASGVLVSRRAGLALLAGPGWQAWEPFPIRSSVCRNPLFKISLPNDLPSLAAK